MTGAQSKIAASNGQYLKFVIGVVRELKTWTREQAMKRAVMLSALLISTAPAAGVVEAAVGFDGQTNSMVDQATRDTNRETFDAVETIEDSLGPVYNAQSCRECRQTRSAAAPVRSANYASATPSRPVPEPVVRINNGKETIAGRTPINDRAICPQAQRHGAGSSSVRLETVLISHR